MKWTLPLIIILTILAFAPGIIGTALNKGTGIMPVDLIIFTILPFIIVSLLLHFMFKYPSEVSTVRVKGAVSTRAPSFEALQSEEKFEEVAAAEPEFAPEAVAVAEPEVTCPECGGIVTMNDPICPHCGVKFEEEKGEEILPEEPAVAQPEPEPEPEILPEIVPEEPKAPQKDFGLKCPTCGGSVGLEEKFCPHCGADFEEKGAGKSEEDLDALLGIAPEEKPVEKEEPKPAPQKSDEIMLTYEEPQEEAPAPKKKGKKKR